MIQAIIIDDQLECIEDLQYLISKHKLPVDVVAVATSAAEGLTLILKHKPNLVFLDIIMPVMNGFEMLNLLPEINFQLIVTTSSDKFAIQALRASAIDFLLKPIIETELIQAISKIKTDNAHPTLTQISAFNDSLNNQNKLITKIALPISDGVEMVPVDEIIYFQSDGNYTTVHMTNDRKVLVSKQLGKFEDILDSSVFYRIHNSYLVNLNFIRKFIRSDGGYIVLTNDQSLSVARNRREGFLERLTRN